MLFFRYLFDISSLRMNPCSPRFVYLFVVLRILVRALQTLVLPSLNLTYKYRASPAQRWPSYVV
jgi:hypothetical protein